MSNTILTFGAKELSPELLEKTLVGRKTILDRVESELLSKIKEGETYQKILIAPRGSGKTHLIKTLYTRLKANKKLENKIYIAYMVEDEVGISNYLDFLVRILEAFVRWKEKNSEELPDRIYAISDLPNENQEYALQELLLEYLGKNRGVILVENLNEIFDGMGRNGQEKLRSFVHEYNKLSFVATSQSLFEPIQDEHQPFYNFFSITHLQKLDLKGAVELLKVIAVVEGNKELLDSLGTPEMKGKIRAIFDLTQGNHRLLVSFYSFLKAEMKSDLSVVFTKTMNDLKPYYEQFVKNLPAQQQKIVKYLSLNHCAQKGKDISRNCFMPQNTASKQLSELHIKGYIDKNKEGKDVYYELKEPLMRICFEISESPDGIAKLFVDFLQVIYSSEELKAKYLIYKYGSRFQPHHLKEKYLKEAGMMKKAIGSVLEEEFSIYEKGLEGCSSLEEIESYVDLLLKARGKQEKDFKEINDLVDEKRFQEAYNVGISLHEKYKDNERFCIIMGTICLVLGRYDDAVKYYNLVIETSRDDAFYYNLGVAYDTLGKEKEAILAYTNSINLNPNHAMALNNLGGILYQIGEIEEGLESVKRAIKIDSNSEIILSNLSYFLYEQSSYQEAMQYLQRLIKLYPESEYAFSNLGIIYNNLGRYDEAIDVFKKSLKINPNSFSTYYNMGISFYRKKEIGKAIDSYQKSIKLKDDFVEGYNNLAFAYKEIGDYENALTTFKKGEKTSPKNQLLKIGILNIYLTLNDIENSKHALDRILKLKLEPEDFKAAIKEDVLLPLLTDGSPEFVRCFLEILKEKLVLNKSKDLLNIVFPPVVLDFLLKIGEASIDRLISIEGILEDFFSNEPNARIPLVLFNVGIRYLKQGDQKAIYDLSKEERKVFQEFVLDKI